MTDTQGTLNFAARAEPLRIPLPDAELQWFEHAFSVEEADRYFSALTTATPWRRDDIRVHGKTFPLPRLQAWYADDPGATLAYSGMRLPALALSPDLRAIRERVEILSGASFNGVLVNCYRDGQDCVGWHSDNEPEWGDNPVIASVSLGAARDFMLKHIRRKNEKTRTVSLTHGSLLVMGDQVQQNWLHQLPRRARVTAPRINLTFRYLVTADIERA